MDSLTDSAKAQGIFIVRCAAHSFQLVLKDIAQKIDFVAQARKFLCEVVDEYRRVKAASVLSKMQKDANKTPLVLIRPCKTRWNSLYDGWVRLIQLKHFIQVSKGNDIIFVLFSSFGFIS